MQSHFRSTLVLALALSGCAYLGPAKDPVAEVARTGVLECYAHGYAAADGQPVSCETSAVEKVGPQILAISDKKTPDATATQAFWLSPESFGVGHIARSAIRYDRRPLLLSAQKIEAASLSADGAWVFVTTAFDRPPRPAATEADPYNTLLYWPAGSPETIRIAHPTSNQGVVSSASLRARFARALRTPAFPDGPPYFKVEGLAALPGNKLLFGVRETGADYEHFEYCAALIEVGYSFHDGEIRLADDFGKAVFLRLAVPGRPALNLGLSSLLYDSDRQRIWMLTSAEGARDESVNSGYLWSFRVRGESLEAQHPEPLPVKTPQGAPLRFPYKAEGMTLLDKGKLLVVHDEDRLQSSVAFPTGTHVRRQNETIFSIVELR